MPVEPPPPPDGEAGLDAAALEELVDAGLAVEEVVFTVEALVDAGLVVEEVVEVVFTAAATAESGGGVL